MSQFCCGADTIYILLAAEVEPPLVYRGRGINRLVDGVGAQYFMCRACFDYDRVSIFAREKNLSVAGHGRGRECGRDGDTPVLVLDRAGARIQTCEDTAVRRQVQVLIVDDPGRDIGCAALVLQCD